MKIDIPYEIGDPVIVLDYSHGGWNLHIPLIKSKRMFRILPEVQEPIKWLKEEESNERP